MPQFLTILRPTRVEMLTEGPTEQEGMIVGRHFLYLKDLTQKGTVFTAGRTTENNAETLGIYIFHAQDSEAATALMNADPAVANGVMTAELRPFQVALGLGS
jgi:uncharacterized protein YciI